MEYDFKKQYEISVSDSQVKRDTQILKDCFPDAVFAYKAKEEYDRAGIDYFVVLKNGREIGVDVKTREKGCNRFWKNSEPELALEIWSRKYPFGSGRRNDLGWTLDLSKQCSYVLFKFDDISSAYIFPFVLLSKVFYDNISDWYLSYTHTEQKQKDADYVSECVFVPVSIVTEAVKNSFIIKKEDPL